MTEYTNRLRQERSRAPAAVLAVLSAPAALLILVLGGFTRTVRLRPRERFGASRPLFHIIVRPC
ncbi:hypothetical protein SSBG_01758 [Streptomyces sp. SPB074]|nr:hypothetical protein SSBG_01758 [Streptomyces sp. SPB074]